MNKRKLAIIPVVFSLIFTAVQAQKNKVIEPAVEWGENYKVSLNGQYVRSVFHPKNGYWDHVENIPYLLMYEPIGGNQCDFQLSSVQVEALTLEEEKLLKGINVPEEFQFVPKMSEQRKKNYLSIQVNGVRKNSTTGMLEKLTSFEANLSISNKSKSQLKSYATNSVLQSGSGSWYKLGVTEDGVYRLDYNYLVNLGVDVNNLNSDAINIFGNGAGMLSEQNGVYRHDDLVKNSIFVEDGGDGTFDQGDHILFYAKGPHTWKLNTLTFVHSSHDYCDTSYYFLNVNAASPSAKRIGTASLSSNTATHNINSFTDYAFLENDDVNLAKSGREWYDENVFDIQTTYSYNFDMPNLLSTDSVNVYAKMVGTSSSSSTTFTIVSGGNSTNCSVSSSGSGTYAHYGKYSTGTVRYAGSGNSVNVQITYNKNGNPSAKGYLDYLEVNAPRQLTMTGGQMEFRHPESIGAGNVGKFNVANASQIEQIWEVTDCRNIAKVNYTLSGGSAVFTVNTDSLRTFIAIDGNTYKTPVSFGSVAYQNLHGLGYADMITIVPSEYYSAAADLAAFHLTEDGLTTHIVTIDQVYNEYSSGMRDITAIKHFLKMFYDRAGSDPNLIPKYCLLFGDASYDTRNRLNHNSSFIPTYESTESLNITSTYATDDYFAILSDFGGMSNNDLMDIALGRLPVKSMTEANDMVQKVKNYYSVSATNTSGTCAVGESPSVLRDWRNIVCLVADDEDNNAYFLDSQIMEDSIKVNGPSINIQKIYIDAYPEITTPGGERIYEAEEAIKQRVEKGALLINYIGHGGEGGWAHERILTVSTIQNWTNYNKLPVFMTATCEFSRYDDHDRTSAGEYVVLNPQGGGIVLFTTTRLVYASSNERLNKHFHSIFYDKDNGVPKCIGDIYLKTKEGYVLNGGGDVNMRKFTLLGDPAVRLALPQHQIITDSINGIEISGAIDTLKALSTVTISGHLEDYTGAKMTGFNGVVYPTVYDKEVSLTTLGNNTGSSPAQFDLWKNIVYKGKATVQNGEFSFTFKVPQDISFQYGNARLSYYAENGEEDAHGYSEVPEMGGINLNAAADDQGPDVLLYMNNEDFVSGGITDENPSLYATVFDESGINTVGNGIGHNIEAVLDENTSESIILNDYYEADLDTYKSGKVSYPFSELTEGPHTLSLKVWDVYNNSEKAEIEFIVAKNETFQLDHVLNYPNPFTTRTEFFFEHNQLCDYLDVQIQVFTISGKLVKRINERVHSEGYRSEGIPWNGRDDFGEKIGKGVYVYKIKVMNERGEKVEKFEKLVILN